MIAKRSISFTGPLLIAILFNYFGLFVAPAISYESVEEERTLCVKECKDRYGIDLMWGGLRGGDRGLWRLYFKCINDCEKKFWKEWQNNMDEI